MIRRENAAKARSLIGVFIVQIVYRVKNCLRFQWFSGDRMGRTKDIIEP